MRLRRGSLNPLEGSARSVNTGRQSIIIVPLPWPLAGNVGELITAARTIMSNAAAFGGVHAGLPSWAALVLARARRRRAAA